MKSTLAILFKDYKVLSTEYKLVEDADLWLNIVAYWNIRKEAAK
jgi:hypothetical protein